MISDNTVIDSDLDVLLHEHFAGRVVRKDLTKLVKEGANVPVYVLEYLLGNYCATDDPVVINDGLATVKRILAENYVRPDEAEQMKSIIRERGRLRVIDKVSVKLNEKRDVYEASLLNLGTRSIEVDPTTVRKYEKLLAGGIWSIITLQYYYDAGQKSSPFVVEQLKPIQMPNMDMEELLAGRSAFTENQWIDILLRSSGYEPTQFDERAKWHILCRLVPLVENNFNVCELGPRGTGKSHIYKEISPYSILVSGGQTTVANLFYNLSSRMVGLVGLWDVVAFDEVAGISFKDKGGVQIMKDYMASGSFARGRDQINAQASMVFIGNINQSVDTLVKTSHLLSPFPEAMIDPAFFDRFHAYIPGWEIPKMRPEFFTNQYGLIVDYLAEFLREMRKRNFGDAINKYYKLGRDLNQRDTIGVRHTVSGLLKLLYPNERYTKESVQRCLEYALETRRRVKEQLKKIGGMEFYDVHFSYINQETMEERHVAVPEQGGCALIPEGPLAPGVLHVIATGNRGHLGVYRIETQVTAGSGKFRVSGLGSNTRARESILIGYEYFKANVSSISASVHPKDNDFHVQVTDLQNAGPTTAMTLAAFLALTSSILGKPIRSQLVALGNMSLGGSITPADNLAESLQATFDAGATRILLPASSVSAIATVPGELLAKFQTSFYADPRDAAFKSLGLS